NAEGHGFGRRVPRAFTVSVRLRVVFTRSRDICILVVAHRDENAFHRAPVLKSQQKFARSVVRTLNLLDRDGRTEPIARELFSQRFAEVRHLLWIEYLPLVNPLKQLPTAERPLSTLDEPLLPLVGEPRDGVDVRDRAASR